MIHLCFNLSKDTEPYPIEDYCEICKRAFGMDEHARCGVEFKSKGEPWSHVYWWFFIGPLIALVIFFVYARRVQVRNLLKKFTHDSDQEEQIPLTNKCENGRTVKKFRLFFDSAFFTLPVFFLNCCETEKISNFCASEILSKSFEKLAIILIFIKIVLSTFEKPKIFNFVRYLSCPCVGVVKFVP